MNTIKQTLKTYPLLWFVPIVIALALIVAVVSYVTTDHTRYATGTVEATHIDVAAKIPARIKTFRVEEGDSVAAGDTLLLFENREIGAKVGQARAALGAAEARYAMVMHGARKEEIAMAEKTYRQADWGMEVMKKTYDRMKPLHDQGVISSQQWDEVDFKYRAAVEQRDAAYERYIMVRSGTRIEEKDAASSLALQARSAVAEAESYYDETSLRAPVHGIVEKCIADSTTRIMQEILLGIGGVRLLRALGIQPSVFHMNEGHAAFLTLELMREKHAAGATFEESLEATRQECIFTTHTPVEAGHDRFTPDLMQYALHRFPARLGVRFEKLMALGRVDPANTHEAFCMTVLALKASRAANAVSELHGQVSREMWQPLYPGLPADKVPIGHVTNGIHLLGWMKGPTRRFYQKKNGENLEREVNEPGFWRRMADPACVSDEELWAFRYQLKREMIEFARRRLLLQGHRLDRGDYITYDQLLNVDALTIGFARRFATYKRAPLIFDRFHDIVSLVKDKTRPVQFVFAGKAHPKDDDGKRYIQKIVHLSKYSELKGHVVFIENYDMHVARQMVSGCDVWLNNPRRPLEASGTSGMKAGPNGCLNLIILDGWWREGYDGSNGFAIGDDSHPEKVDEQDRQDASNLYQMLTEEVIPCFFERDASGLPRRWIQKMRRAMATLVPQYNTWRMVQEYTRKYYLAK
jgi:alpha-glucan phosphorylase-like protein